MKVIHVGAESVCQNCVIGRCAHLHIHILLHLPSLFYFFFSNLRLGLKFVHVNFIGMVGAFCYTVSVDTNFEI